MPSVYTISEEFIQVHKIARMHISVVCVYIHTDTSFRWDNEHEWHLHGVACRSMMTVRETCWFMQRGGVGWIMEMIIPHNFRRCYCMCRYLYFGAELHATLI